MFHSEGGIVSQWAAGKSQPTEFHLRTRFRLWAVALLTALALGGCGRTRNTTDVKLPPPVKGRIGWTETGIASWYGHPYHGRKTSNGETYDMNKLTAAHKRLPLGTWIRVTNLTNGRKVQVRVNDRGPFVGRRVVDLSKAAAQEIGMMNAGTARVRLRVIRPPRTARRTGSRRDSTPSRRENIRFDVQIGVFSDEARANTMAARVRKWGLKPRILRTSETGHYRVLVPGGNRNNAESRRRQLKRKGIDGILRPRTGD